jgi:uncharacterized protein (TIGR03435 family)
MRTAAIRAALLPMRRTSLWIVLASLVWPAQPRALAQGVPARPQFDVVSVKPTPQERLRITEDTTCKNGTFRSGGFPISFAIRWSYQLGDSQVLGLPEWARDWNFGYDIEAKSAAPVSLDQCQLMVQSLLADRFKMTAHREIREIRGYALVIGERGPKLRAIAGAGAAADTRINGQVVADSPDSQGMSMSGLAHFLSAHPAVGFPVIDRTKLTGRYSFNLVFSPWRYSPDSTSADDDRPSILTGIKALGLKLDVAQVPVGVLAVDHIEKAGEN